MKFNCGWGCGGMCYDKEGVFKVETGKGEILYFFYSTVEGGMYGMTTHDLFADESALDDSSVWRELYTVGIDADEMENSEYSELYKEFEKYVNEMPAQVKEK